MLPSCEGHTNNRATYSVVGWLYAGKPDILLVHLWLAAHRNGITGTAAIGINEIVSLLCKIKNENS